MSRGSSEASEEGAGGENTDSKRAETAKWEREKGRKSRQAKAMNSLKQDRGEKARRPPVRASREQVQSDG